MSVEAPPIVDALPYVDTAIDDDDNQRAAAMKELDDELDVFAPQRDYLEHLQPLEPRTFCTPLIRHEHERLEAGKPQPAARDLADTHADTPPPTSSSANMDAQEHEVWQRCLDQLKIKLEYLSRQSVNLELIKSYGAAAWQNFIDQNEATETELKGELESLERRIQEINWHRKTEQERVEKTLQVLRGEWIGYVDKNRILFHEFERLNAQFR